jgi:hypothetical protein
LRKARPRRRTTGKQTVVASPYAPEGTRQGRKQLEKGAAKETRKDTPAAPSFRLALFKRSQLALFCRAAPEGHTSQWWGVFVAEHCQNDVTSFRWPRSPAGIGVLVAVALGFVLFGLLLPSQENLYPFLSYKWTLILLSVPFFAMPIMIYSDPAQGTFRLNHDGIQQVSLFRKPKHLRWEDVQRVQWAEPSCCLEGAETSISMKFVPYARRAKAILESALSAYFDLSIKPERRFSFDPNMKSILIFAGKVIGAVVAGTSVFMIGFVGTLFLQPPWRLWLGAAWFFLFLGGVIALAGPGLRKERRISEQINPTWRFRRKGGQTG